MRHRDEVVAQLSRIGQQLSTEFAAFEGEGFVEVRLRQAAWAKSNRPVDKLFSLRNNAILVGGNEIADLVFRVSAASIKRIAQQVEETEPEGRVRIHKVTGKESVVVTEARSETGSIDSITLWGPEQRDAPSADEAIRHLKVRKLAAYYRVDLFDSVGFTTDADDANDVLVADFWRRLKRLAARFGIAVTHDTGSSHPAIGIALLSGTPRLVIRTEAEFVGQKSLLLQEANFEPADHESMLSFLTGHPLVRAIGLPAIVSAPDDLGFEISAASSVPAYVKKGAAKAAIARRGEGWPEDKRYPRVCVVDGGISSHFKRWVVYTEHVVADRDEDHGSNIASLLVAGRLLNEPIQDFLEEDGCELIDLAMMQSKTAGGASIYPTGAAGFLDQLDVSLADLKKKVPFRIVNLSLNIERQVPTDKISDPGRRLDEIAAKHDLIFVVSAGNALGPAGRSEWPSSLTDALQTLLVSNDRLQEPADTLTNVAVAALNPPGVARTIANAPARYSRRGTGLRTVKPDLCHFGGTGGSTDSTTGLVAVDSTNEYRFVNGTSYSAPLISKTLAALDLELAGNAPREVLLALLYHSASLRQPLDHKDLRTAAKQLVGFGLPGTAAQILASTRSSFTFVFFDRLKAGESFKHDFKWPAPLVNSKGGCTGTIKATLVSSPPLAFRYGAEATRMNIDLFVRQAKGTFTPKGEPSFMTRVSPVHSLGAPKGSGREASLLSQSLKWSPVKVYEGELDETGVSADWQFGVNYLERDKTVDNMPAEGVPVAVVLTISDPSGSAGVFDNMRASLQNSGLTLQDIRVALRNQARV